MKTKLEQSLESGTIQFPRGLTGEERRAFIKEKLVDSVEKARRKLFENEYVQYRQYLKRNKDGSYSEEWVDARWQGFNAALDLLVIELPFTTYYSETQFTYGVDGSRKAIESLNLGIKIK